MHLQQECGFEGGASRVATYSGWLCMVPLGHRENFSEEIVPKSPLWASSNCAAGALNWTFRQCGYTRGIVKKTTFSLKDKTKSILKNKSKQIQKHF